MEESISRQADSQAAARAKRCVRPRSQKAPASLSGLMASGLLWECSRPASPSPFESCSPPNLVSNAEAGGFGGGCAPGRAAPPDGETRSTRSARLLRLPVASRNPIAPVCRQPRGRLSRGALIPASDWLDFYLLSPCTCALARGSCTDCAGFITIGSRWARLAGIRSRRSRTVKKQGRCVSIAHERG